MERDERLARAAAAAAMLEDPTTLTARYIDLLQGEGYRPRARSADGRHAVLFFTVEGRVYTILVEEDDATFFHLATRYDLPPNWLGGAATARAAQLNRTYKVAKITFDPLAEAVRFEIELFHEAPVSGALLARSLRVLRLAVHDFFERSPRTVTLQA